jgi:uncharacterized protein YybS (DUF2232 family)
MPDNTMAKRYQRSNQNARQYNGLLLWYLLVIVLSGILITSLVSFGDCIVWNSDYFFGIFWALYCLAVRSNQNARPYNYQKIPKK